MRWILYLRTASDHKHDVKTLLTLVYKTDRHSLHSYDIIIPGAEEQNRMPINNPNNAFIQIGNFLTAMKNPDCNALENSLNKSQCIAGWKKLYFNRYV